MASSPRNGFTSLLIGACCWATVAIAPAAFADESATLPIEKLGARLFSDKTLSEPQGVACASCHDPARAFSGVNGSTIAGVAAGAPAGSFGVRKPPGLTYAAFTPPFGFIDKEDETTGRMEKTPAGGQFRDGRAADLEEQAAGPLLNPVEMANPSKAAVVEKVKNGPYASLVREVFGANVFDDPDKAFDRLTQAIAAFERTAVFRPFAPLEYQRSGLVSRVA